MTRSCFFTLMLALAAATPMEAAPDSQAIVAIRTYNYGQIPAEQLARARVTAEDIFEPAGIALRWIDCRVPQSESGSACTEPLDQGRDLVLRLMEHATHGPADAGRVVALGTSMLDREQRGGVLMTVDLFPIRAIAGETLTDVPTLLGRAIAHEIGHLVLGTSQHPQAGLMRALWSRDELRGIKPAHWQFSTREAAQMRHGLALRARGGELIAPIAPDALIALILGYTPIMANNLKLGLAAAMAALTLASPVSAQTNRIGGIVRDETGGTIRGAIVRATPGTTETANPSVGLTTVTDDRGRFVFLVARSGDWRIAFEAPGFQSMVLPVAIRLTGPPANLEVKLERHESPEAFGALAGIDAKSLSAQLASAATLFDEGRYDQALTAYNQIKARAPALSLVNLQIGNVYLAKKSYPEAEAAFQEIVKEDPQEANGLFAMGAVREAQGRTAEAQDWYQKASAADSAWTRPLMKMALLATANGDRAAASRHLTRVIDLDPASADAQQAAAMLKQTP